MIRAFIFAALASAWGCCLAVQMRSRWAPDASSARPLRRWARAALALALVAEVAALVQHGQSLLNGPSFEPTTWAAVTASAKTWVGQVACVQAALIAVALGLCMWRGAGVALLWLLPVAAAGTAMSGHAVASGESAVVSVAALVHVMLAALWFGALGPLWFVRRAMKEGALPVRWAALLQAFSRVALPAMLGILASGLVLATWSVGRWAALFATPYGWVLSAKLGAVAAVLVLAASLRRWLSQAVQRDGGDPGARAGRWLAAEQMFACAIVLAAGTLAGMVPAAHDPIRWPFSFRLSPEAAWLMRAEQIRWPLMAAAALLVVGALAVAAASRRSHRMLFAGGLATLAASAALFLPAVAVDAYPTTYAASAAAYETSSVVAGARLYQQHCSACHGAHGRGDGALAARLDPRPANLTEPHLGWHSHGDMYWWLTHGFPNSAMPGFDRVTTDVERWHLINYLTALSLGHQARNLGPRPVPRDPWLAAIDFRFQLPDGSYSLLSELRGNQAALLVFVNDEAEMRRLPLLAAAAPQLAALATRVIVMLPPGFASDTAASKPMESLDIVADDSGEIAAAWALYRRTLASPDFRDEQVAPPRLEFLIDRFGFVRARWRADELPGEPTVAQLTQTVAALALEPELKSADVHAH